MKGAATLRILPGDQRGAFTRADVVVPPTPDSRELVWTQRLVQRSVRYSFMARQVRFTFMGMGVQR